MKAAEKIQELERRIRELEARPVYVPIYIGAPLPSIPCHQPLPWWRQTWMPPSEIVCETITAAQTGMTGCIGGAKYLNTTGCAPAPTAHIYEFTA